jgi:hypothetical protein
MTNNTQDLAAIVAAVMAAMGTAPDMNDKAAAKRIAARDKKAVSLHALAAAANETVVDAVSDEGTVDARTPLYAARTAAITGGLKMRAYAAILNDLFTVKGANCHWTQTSEPKLLALVEAERVAFVKEGKQKDLANPRVHWANVRKYAAEAAGITKGKPDPKSYEEQVTPMVHAAFKNGLRLKKPTSRQTKITDLLGEIARLLAGSDANAVIADLKASAAKPRMGEPGYVHPSKAGKAKRAKKA